MFGCCFLCRFFVCLFTVLPRSLCSLVCSLWCRYRNKMDFAFSLRSGHGNIIGMFERRTPYVVPINECLIQTKLSQFGSLSVCLSVVRHGPTGIQSVGEMDRNACFWPRSSSRYMPLSHRVHAFFPFIV